MSRLSEREEHLEAEGVEWRREIKALRAEIAGYAGQNTNLKNDLVLAGMARDRLLEELDYWTRHSINCDAYDSEKFECKCGLRAFRLKYIPGSSQISSNQSK